METLLVVNDDPVQLHLLCTLLETEGWKAVKAHNGADAIHRLCGEDPIDAVIVNMDMRRMDGWRLCRSLRFHNDPALRELPILVLSTIFSQDEAEEILLVMRANAFLPLPITPLQLKDSVRGLLGGQFSQTMPAVLIVDGVNSQASRLREAFESRHWDVHCAKTEQEGLRILSELVPDLVVLHHDGSEQAGWGVLKRLEVSFPETPSVVILDVPDSALLGEAFRYGADRYVHSPYDPVELVGLGEQIRQDRWIFQLGQQFAARRHGIREMEACPKRPAVLPGPLQEAQNLEIIGRKAEAVAHDVNKILAAILAQTGRIDRVSDTGSPSPANRVIAQAARRGQELASQLLGQRVDQALRNVPVDLHTLIREVVNLFDFHETNGVKIDTELEATSPYGLGDPCQVHQVLLNLLVNGCEAMPDGGTLTIRTSTEWIEKEDAKDGRDIQPGYYVHLSVTDTGHGMSTELQGKVFEPYVTSKAHGTGMGLATVADVVRQHGGMVRIGSAAKSGTTVHVYWPSVMAGQASWDHHEDAVVEGEGTILVVENEAVVAGAMKELLNSLGYDVCVACNGREAVEVYRRKTQEIDVVLLDMFMPEMGGPECFDALKDINPDVKVLLSTGNPHDQRVSELLQQGVEGVVSKPFDLEVFSRAIADMVHRPVLKGA